MTPIRYIQLAASPGLSLPGLHPHLQGLPGFPVGSQMVPIGMSARFLSQTASFLPSVSDSSVLQQQFPFPQSIFSSPVRTVPGPMECPVGKWQRINHGS